MSELINNRQKKLKEIIKGLHEGTDFETAKKEFQEHFGEITTKEISAMEQALIKDGMAIEEIQRLCDVHAAVFEGSISDIHSVSDHTKILGHPVEVFKTENVAIENLIKTEIEPYLGKKDKTSELMVRIGFDRLYEIDKHYKRKELLFFPPLEKNGITGPPQVMWAVDDEIRAEIKEVINALSTPNHDYEETLKKINSAIHNVREMIFKEDNILLPLLLETLKYFDWIMIDSASDEIGYFLNPPKHRWVDKKDVSEINEVNEEQQIKQAIGEVLFDAGSLEPSVVNAILNTIPFDMTFVDADGYVKYFTQGKERIFDRPLTVIGRHVTMCHPPQSVGVVEEIIESFRSGRKDHEDFWIPLKDMFVHIRYFAVRDKENNYLGTLELTQDIKPIRDLEGEKRLLSKD